MIDSTGNQKKFDLLVILGATATGKTELAAHLAHKLGAEIISADSRQVYRRMDLGTGKDYEDYVVQDSKIPYHLIDIADPGYKYSVFEYQSDFLKVYQEILSRNVIPILCGGTGMYIESVLNGYRMIPVPPNPKRRSELEKNSMDELKSILGSISELHNTTDLTNKKRLIRAIEIAEYGTTNPDHDSSFPTIRPIIFGVKYDRDSRRKRITERLRTRLKSGMIEEVQELLKYVDPEDLIYYGLEYKFLTFYCTGKISHDELFESLNTAIHQFAKRQMTWFRKMEKQGHKITWLDGYMAMEDKINKIIEQVS